MIDMKKAPTLKITLATLGLFLFAGNLSCASPRSRVHTTTRSDADPVANNSSSDGVGNESDSNQNAAFTYYINLVGASAGEIDTEQLPGVVANRVRLFTAPHLGLYPKLWRGRRINGGLPQLADLENHLARVRRDVVAALPNPDWDGFAVIDYEAWHLLWEYMPEKYREESRKVVRAQHPNLPETQVEEIAKGQFENAAMRFLTETLDLCRQLRPKARWGMYGYPQSARAQRLEREKAFYTHVDALFPSVYARKWSVAQGKPKQGQATLSRYKNRIKAVVQASRAIAQDRPVLVYTWPRYNTSNATYGRSLLNDMDLKAMLTDPAAAGADGVILWDVIKTHSDSILYQRLFQDKMLPTIQSITGSSNGPSAADQNSTSMDSKLPEKKSSQRRNSRNRRSGG